MLDRRGNVLHRLGRPGRAFSAVALTAELDEGLALERAGRLLRLRFEPRPAPDAPVLAATLGIWEQRDDLYSLDFAPGAGNEGAGLIALGHHAAGLTALDGRGQLLWRLGPREGLGGAPRTWHAAISADGTRVYAASLGGQAGHATRSAVVAVAAALGQPVGAAAMDGRVTMLAALPPPLGVAVVHRDGDRVTGCCRLSALDRELKAAAWSLACPPGENITAMVAAPDLRTLFVGTNTGKVRWVGAFSGRVLAECDLLYGSTVLSVAAAATGEIAAGLANGQVAFLESTERK
jgi:hypothetical protein